MHNPLSQLTFTSDTPVGEGWLQRGTAPRDVFKVICLKGVYVIHPADVVRVFTKLAAIGFNVPWAREQGGGRTWCGPSYVCSNTGAPDAVCDGAPWIQTYGVQGQPGLCLPQYDYTQRPGGRASSFCWNKSNSLWAAFWHDVGNAIRIYNA